MSKKLIVVESPSKIKTIQKYINTDEFIVKASYGHIADLAKGGKFGIGVNLNNFEPHYKINDDKIKVLDELINAAMECEEVYLFTDDDREGGAIAYHIKKYLETTKKPIKRSVFSEITKKGIEQGLSKLGEVDTNVFKSQETRRILDRIVGFTASPFLINFYGPNLSAGRVQSVAVRMIVDRESEINNFKPQEYYNVFANVSKDKNNYFSVKLENKINTKEEAEKIKDLLIEKNDLFVQKVEAKDKKEKPFQPLTTSKLQQVMAKKFSMDADRTMKAAQSLYENGYCTYIRTDSVRISDEALTEVREWLKANKFEIPKTANKYEVKNNAQNAHECIRPSDVSVLPSDKSLSGDEQLVYRMIWRFFVSCQMNPAIYSTLNVKIVSKSNPKIIFKASGKTLKYKGYLQILGTTDQTKIDIPDLSNNDVLFLDEKNPIKTEQKYTQPPPRFNQATILKELETKGIGRPSTYAEIIKKISERKYVEISNNTYKPTELGKKITEILVKYFPFMNYDYTSELENKLDEIESGKIKSIDVLNNFFNDFKKDLNNAYKDKGACFCDKCKNHSLIKIEKFGGDVLICSFPGCWNKKIIKENKDGDIESNVWA